MSLQRRAYREIDGILLLDKPLGLSSNAALQKARALFKAAKAGHAGSLDPLASGLLPVCFGQATKVCGRLLNAGKTYVVGIQLGARTESLDCETQIVERAPVPPLDEASADAALAGLVGPQEQVPPMHSALKHQGKRLYEFARRGESVERAARPIVIHRLQRVALTADRLDVEVYCSKGTYIRTLAADIAARLGTLGYVASLRRLSIEPFERQPMHTFEALDARAAQDAGVLDSVLLPVDTAFADLPLTQLDARAEAALLLGQAVVPAAPAASGLSRAYDAERRFLALVEAQADGRVRPVRLFVPCGAGGTQSRPPQ
jgi:tRNA pseudouridine55 synthase